MKTVGGMHGIFPGKAKKPGAHELQQHSARGRPVPSCLPAGVDCLHGEPRATTDTNGAKLDNVRPLSVTDTEVVAVDLQTRRVAAPRRLSLRRSTRSGTTSGELVGVVAHSGSGAGGMARMIAALVGDRAAPRPPGRAR
jgi:ABC-type glutathione transport system ATPase component